ncbi:MAG: hypothetical protein WCO60_16995 [Verrucomicrobiota bacterium]
MNRPDSHFAGASVATHTQWDDALRLVASFHTHHPGRPFHLLCLAPPPKEIPLPHNLTITLATELAIADFESAAMRYQPEEFAARLKPHFLLQLLCQYEKVCYLAPEIFVCASLAPALSHLDKHSILLAPKFTNPFTDPLPGPEVEALISGHFHSGFFAVRQDPTGSAFLRWLNDRCRELAFDEPLQGLFLDQKWLNLVPCLFEGVYIDRSPGLLIGDWNLRNRTLSKSQTCWFLEDETSVTLFFRHPQTVDSHLPEKILPSELLLASDASPETQTQLDYPFGSFSDGAPISPIARQLYSISSFPGAHKHPFDAHSSFEAFCRKHRLIGPGNPTLRPEALPPNHLLARTIRWCFYAVLRIFGAPLYELFLKYLRFLSSVRNQNEVFFSSTTPEDVGLDSKVYGRIRK